MQFIIRHKKKILVSLSIVLACGVFSVLTLFMLVNRPNKLQQPVSFDIPSGAGAKLIASRLELQNVVSSKYVYLFATVIAGKTNSIQAGIYTIKPGMTPLDLIDLFQHGTNDVKLTFIEGWRLEEFAEYAAAELKNVTYEDFMTLTSGDEGRLFPDTYYVNADITTQDLVVLLENTFTDKTADLLLESQMDGPTTLIMASLLEREGTTLEDKKIVAGILRDRLSDGVALQVDATVQYVVGRSGAWWPKTLTQADLAIDSPYNTRKYAGLPPAPISSFGLISLEAAVHPITTGYYYYLTGKDGQMYYASTYDEHLANIANYLGQ